MNFTTMQKNEQTDKANWRECHIPGEYRWRADDPRQRYCLRDIEQAGRV